MSDVGIDLENFDVCSAMTLVVGWTSGRSLKLRQVLLSQDVAAAFRDVVQKATSQLAQREPAAWTPDADLSPETYLVLDADQVGDSPNLASEHSGQKFLSVLGRAERLEEINPKYLPAGDLSFYAIVVGQAGERAVFIRRSNPRRGLKRGRIYSTLSDTLQRVEDPIFAFDEWVDLVSFRGKLGIFSQTVFSAFFRDQETLAKKIPEWIASLAASVPMESDSRDLLETRVKKDSRLKARLEAIVRRDHLSSVSSSDLRLAMEEHELDPDRLMDATGSLRFELDDIPQVLYFLNEDLFTGSLSKVGFRADKKAAR